MVSDLGSQYKKSERSPNPHFLSQEILYEASAYKIHSVVGTGKGSVAFTLTLFPCHGDPD